MMNGIINIYKEKGFTSFDVVAKLRGILKTRKIGHTGTLDPDAEGVLPVCIGKATKICELLTDKTKEYEAVMLLGRTTDTQDVTGETLTQQEVRCSAKEVEKAVLSFVGDYMQVPPMYSALKVDGRKLCDLARAGVTVERAARPVHIFSSRSFRSNCRVSGCVSAVPRERISARSARMWGRCSAAVRAWNRCSARELESSRLRTP